MKIYILRFHYEQPQLKPRAYVSRELAETHGRLHNPLHYIEEIDVCDDDPLRLAISAMQTFRRLEKTP